MSEITSRDQYLDLRAVLLHPRLTLTMVITNIEDREYVDLIDYSDLIKSVCLYVLLLVFIFQCVGCLSRILACS